MSWAFGINAERREIGYGVLALCDESLCPNQIDRGLAYVCGGMHDGGDWGCGRYFCYPHLYSHELGFMCAECCEFYPDEDDEAG